MVTVEVHSHKVIPSADVGRYRIELELTAEFVKVTAEEAAAQARSEVLEDMSLDEFITWYGEEELRQHFNCSE